MSLEILRLPKEESIDITQTNNLYRKEYAGKLVIDNNQSAIVSKDRKQIYWLADYVTDILVETLEGEQSKARDSKIPTKPLSTAELVHLLEKFKTEDIIKLRSAGLI